MRRKQLVRIAIVVTTGIIIAMTSGRAAAQTETVLYSFKGTDGASPLLGLVFDSAGNLYGVAGEGAGSNNGSVFELSPKSGGGWTEKTLFSFNGGTTGSTPASTLIFDLAGNLYGATKLGGASGYGLAFELTPNSSGPWKQKVLHNFGASKDGQYPTGRLIFDTAGNLYGTTEGGGSHGNSQENTGGIAYELAPQSAGAWAETVLYNFGGSGDGVSPRANLIFDTAGNLYGTTLLGGTLGFGTAFELSPQTGGTWTETVLIAFDHSFLEPAYPYTSLTFDSAGNLYGTTLAGGGFSGSTSGFDGTVFELTPHAGASWTIQTLFDFDSVDGAQPGAGALILDSAGKLYGAAQAGGANKDGVVFQITP
jgi:hypothetical protein